MREGMTLVHVQYVDPETRQPVTITYDLADDQIPHLLDAAQELAENV